MTNLSIFENLFTCPACKEKLVKQNNYYECSDCGVQYSIVDNTPLLIKNSKLRKDISREIETFWDEGWKKRIYKEDHLYFEQLSKSEFIKNIDEYIQTGKQDRGIFGNEANVENIKDKIVVDIGCGGGMQPAIFTHYGAKYIGIDISFEAIKNARRQILKLDGIGIGIQAEAENLPFRNRSIDLIFSHGVLHHTPDTAKAFEEIYRVLKPRGEAIIALYVTFSPHFLLDRFKGMIFTLLSKSKNWFNLGEGAWHTEGHVNPWTKTYTKNELKKMVKKYQYTETKFRKYGFCWGNALPKVGTYIDKTNFGRKLIPYMGPIFGDMWAIYLKK